MRTLTKLAGLAAAGVGLAIGGVAAATTASPLASSAPPVAATEVRTVSPVNADSTLATGYTIHHRYGNASCESGSPTVGKAYECFTPQSPEGIYASCWVQADHQFVLCLDKPWEHEATRLHVSRGYGDASGFTKVKRPWGLRLANGRRCLVIVAPVHVTTHGQRVNYYCNHRGALAGPVNDRHKIWAVSAYREVHRHGRPMFRSLGTQQVAVSWIGSPSQHD